MKKPISKIHLENKIKKEKHMLQLREQGAVGAIGNFALGMGQTFADTATAGLAQQALMTGVNAVINVGSSIAQVYRNINYDLRGCDRITDMNRRTECRNRMKIKESQARMSELNKLLRKCNKAKDPQKCQEQIRQRVDSESEKQQQLRQNY